MDNTITLNPLEVTPTLTNTAVASTAADSDIFKKHGLLEPREVDRMCFQQTRSSGLVEGLIARSSVSVLIGDSGLGKSPLAYQLGLCVAAGIPFLGLPTQHGRVVYAEYENGLEESKELRDQIVKCLRLSQAPNNFMLWTPDRSQQLNIEGICRDVKPALLIIDSLRSHNPNFEKSENAAQEMKSLRSASHHGSSILAVHHIRKPGQDGVPALDSETGLMNWLNQAAGHRSIINQSDTRIAADAPIRVSEAAMVLRWHRRLKGEGGPIYLERHFDGSSGEPLGYSRMTGVELLSNPDQQDAFRRLPDSFAFGQAKAVYGKSDHPTEKWLRKCIDLGILCQPKARGPYEKVSAAPILSPPDELDIRMQISGELLRVSQSPGAGVC
jgi:hypothetical protein